MPKFIVKPKPAAANPQKKPKTESAAVQDNVKAPAPEEKGGASEEKTNVLQSLCQYDSDESDDWRQRFLESKDEPLEHKRVTRSVIVCFRNISAANCKSALLQIYGS